MSRLRDRSSQKNPSSPCELSGLSPIPESKGVAQVPFGYGGGSAVRALPVSSAQLKGANTFTGLSLSRSFRKPNMQEAA